MPLLTQTIHPPTHSTTHHWSCDDAKACAKASNLMGSQSKRKKKKNVQQIKKKNLFCHLFGDQIIINCMNHLLVNNHNNYFQRNNSKLSERLP